MREKAAIIVAAFGILAGFALFEYGEWSTGVGISGVVNRLVQGVGLLLLGLGVFIIGVTFAKWLGVGHLEKSPAARKAALGEAGRQLAVVVVNILIYGGIFILVMGGIAALDGATPGTIVVVFALWAACLAGFVAYRRYRKRHNVEYRTIGSIGMTVFMLMLGLGILALGGKLTADAACDLSNGPESADVFLVDAHGNLPSWRYRFAVQSDIVLTFFTPDEQRIVLEVPDGNVDDVKVINDYGNFVHLSYYPRTQIFDGAYPWRDGLRAMGTDLLARLNETYDFEL